MRTPDAIRPDRLGRNSPGRSPMVALLAAISAIAPALPLAASEAPCSRAASREADAIRFLFSSSGFEPNVGQADPRAAFVARGSNHVLYLTAAGPVLMLGNPDQRLDRAGRFTTGVAIRLVGADAHARTGGLGRQIATVNYLMGGDSAKWRTGIATFAQVTYRGVYPGVDVIYQVSRTGVGCEFVLAADVNPSVIRLRFEGPDGPEPDSNGDLVISSEGRLIRMLRPEAFLADQPIPRPVACEFRLDPDTDVAVPAVADHESRRPLTIRTGLACPESPEAVTDQVCAVAADRSGAAWLAGVAYFSDIPAGESLRRVPLASIDGAYACCIVRFAPGGGPLLHATYFGGGHNTVPRDLACDGHGNVYVVGHTTASDLPGAAGFQSAYAGPAVRTGYGDAFIARLDSTGRRILLSTYLGGGHNDGARAIALDQVGNLYVAGLTVSDDFPIRGAAQPERKLGEDVFVCKLDPLGHLAYSTFISGADREWPADVAVDAAGRAYVVGTTQSTDFPVVNGVQSQRRGEADAFLVRLNASGSSFDFATYLGGGQFDEASCIVVDANGCAYVGGWTNSSDFPVAGGETDPAARFSIGVDGFVARFSLDWSRILHSRYFGAGGDDAITAMAFDESEGLWITGSTDSVDLPVVPPTQTWHAGRQDAIVARLRRPDLAITSAAFVGGSDVDSGLSLCIDPAGRVLVAGMSRSPSLRGGPAPGHTARTAWRDLFVAPRQ